jgi:UDPglucose--hexose-1-phosphate uridylyltransferase
MEEKVQQKDVNKEPEKKPHTVGEMRQDLVTGKWVVIATGRAGRPDSFATENTADPPSQKYKEDCPFCNLAKHPQEPDVLRLPDSDETWQVHIFGNKYPAFLPKEEFRAWTVGPYRVLETVGYHELLATRYHNQFDSVSNTSLLNLTLEALLLRFRQLRTKSSVNYIQIIKNHGPEAGGSVEHPHHQIITVPVLPDVVADMLHGTERYVAQFGKDPFSVMMDFERSEGHRIIWENEHFTAFCPFASRVPFETWIMPRKPLPFFETLDMEKREALAEAMRQVFGRLHTGLHNPPYNYYLYSAPCDTTGFVCYTEIFTHFRWHIEILPRLSKFGGFELSTGLEINPTTPEHAASFLRDQPLPNPVM